MINEIIGRFRCLKLPILYQSKETIDNMFFTCCVLHNMLLACDGLDVRWEKNAQWAGQGGLHDHDDLDIFRKLTKRVKENSDFAREGINQLNIRGNADYLNGEEEIESTHSSLKKNLINHFNYQYKHGRIEWLK